MKVPVEGDEDGSFVLMFSDCTFKEDGGGMDAYRAAYDEWNAYADEHGIVGGAWMMFPIYGENQDADYDFKAVASAPDYTTWGAVWNLYAEGHYQKEAELFNGIVDCDSGRVYSVNVEREMAEEEEG